MGFQDEVTNEMYGSIHTHFEDWFDTANDTASMIKNFAKLGCKKIAITGHGSMFSYEDAKEVISELKAPADEDHPNRDPIPSDVEIVPGVEVYFTDEAKHMVLIAKDYEGYQCLCKVITESSHNSKNSKNSSEDDEYLTPIVTLDNLRRNIKKGKVVATSACVGGVFCHDLGLIDYKLKEKIEKAEESTKKYYINAEGEEVVGTARERRDYALKFIEDYKKNDAANKMPTKAERTRIEKIAAKHNENGETSQAKELLDLLDSKIKAAEEYKLWKTIHKPEYNEAKKLFDKSEKELEKVEKAKAEYEAYHATFEERFSSAKEEYKQLEEIFGKENFFFELQNHGLEMEKDAYNSVVKLAYEVGNPNFIASNDVHIGDRKGSDTWKQSVKRREFERFNRFKSIDNKRGDEEEYGIKTDNEIVAALVNILEPFTDKDGVTHTPSEIANAAIGNISTALKDCHVEFPEISINGVNHYPKFCEDEALKFREEVEKGAKERFPNGLPEGYRERLDYEMGIIESMGYSGYHLIVKDYLEYGRLLGYLRTQEDIDNAPLDVEELKKYLEEKNVPRVGMSIGPGRGSAAGSLVCYCLKITDLDPIPLGLLFERFLNPSRQTMPDIDSDFKDDIRDHVYEYIKARYGDECVSKVCTKSYAHGKKALMVARAYLQKDNEKKLEEESGIKYLYPQDPRKKDFQAKVKAFNREVLVRYNKLSKDIDRVMDANGLSSTKTEDGTKAISLMLQSGNYEGEDKRMLQDALDIAGIPGTLSMHACACLISGDPLGEVIPLAWNDANKKMTTQCLYPQAEELGLLKMDLLGLKNLTVITKVLQATNDENLLHPESLKEVLADPKIYRNIYSNGYTQGVFQVESPGMTKMMKDFKPTCFEDIILLVAAYRPGPMAFIPEIIAAKRYQENPENNPKPVKSITIQNEKLNAILAPTYGVPIYQEQVMQIFQKIAGYDLAGADNVRRFMSKKKVKKLEAEKPRFIKGCEENGISKEEAEKFFGQLVDFSKYAFNKSHAACYALVSVMTAYLKCYHARIFYKESMSMEMLGGKSSDVLEKYMPEIERLGDKINVLPPEIGRSQADISNEGHSLRLGYGNIKGEPYVTYEPAGNIEDFVDRNPELSDASLKKFIKLGMLKAAWNTSDLGSGVKGEVIRCKGNTRYLEEFVDKYFSDIKRRAVCKAKLAEIESNVTSAEDAELVTSLKEEIEMITRELKKARDYDYSSEAEEIKEDMLLKMKSIEDEKDLLGYNFNLSKEADILKGKNGDTFASLEKLAKEGTSTTLHSGKWASYNFPGVILSSEQMFSKKGNPFYKLKIIDKDKCIKTVTSFHNPTLMAGKLSLTYTVSDNGYGDSIILSKELPFEAEKLNTPDKTQEAERG